MELTKVKKNKNNQEKDGYGRDKRPEIEKTTKRKKNKDN